MKSRERILAAFVILLFGYLGTQWLIKRVLSEPLRLKEAQIDSLVKQIEEKEKQLMNARMAEGDLLYWKAASLPADRSVYSTHYLEYLTNLFVKAGIKDPKISPSAGEVPIAENAKKTSFGIKAKANLATLTRVLYEFYQSPILHQIRRLKLTPVIEKGLVTGVEIDATVEALSLKEAVAKDRLPTLEDVKPFRPPAKDRPLDEYNLVADKNIFQPTQYTDVRAREVARQLERPEIDERADYRIAGAWIVDGQGRILLTNEKSSKTIEVDEGQMIDIPGMKAKLVDVSMSQVLLQVADKLGTVLPGETLARWTATEPATVPVKDENGRDEPDATR